MKTIADEQLVEKWKNAQIYDFNLLTDKEQIELSRYMEEVITSLGSKSHDTIHDTLRKRCITWIHRYNVT